MERSRFSFPTEGDVSDLREEEFENAFDLLLQDVVKDLKDQTKSMVLKVTLEGQEENLYRTLELPYGLALDEMVHMILGTFKVSSTHLYNISYKHDTFMCDLTPYSLNLVENHLYAGDSYHFSRSKTYGKEVESK